MMIGTDQSNIIRSVILPVAVNMIEMKRNRSGMWIDFCPTTDLTTLTARLF